MFPLKNLLRQISETSMWSNTLLKKWKVPYTAMQTWGNVQQNRTTQNKTNYFPLLRHDCGAHYHRISTGQEISRIQKKVRNVHELEEEELYQ